MTPEERQLLGSLADRIKNAPNHDIDAEADQMLKQLVQVRPDTAYLLAQTVLMQDFALRSAQAQITQLQAAQQQVTPPEHSSGSFLGNLFGGAKTTPQPASSVPSVNPWGRPATAQPQQPAYAAEPQAYAQPAYQPVVMQPSQTSGFLRQAATTAAGVAGGALLFEGIQSLFSGHQGYGGGGGGFLGPSAWGGGSGFGPQESLTETTIVNNYYDDPAGQNQQQSDYVPDQDQGGYQDAVDPGTDSSADDFSGGGDDYV